MKKEIGKYLLPWETQIFEPNTSEVATCGSVSYVRKLFGVEYENKAHCISRVMSRSSYFDHIADGLWRHTHRCESSFNSAIEAMNDADKDFLERGYYLIGENEVERFKKKLVMLL